MKRYILVIFLCVFFLRSFSQVPGEWVWVSGFAAPNTTGVYGNPGELDPNFVPPAAYEAAEWTDLNYNFWVFGGLTPNYVVNSLFFYDRATNQWAIMTGTPGASLQGDYGTKGVAASTNTPGARGYGVMTWTDKTGNLWLFGGYGLDKYGNTGQLADMWKYEIATNMWTWMAGPDTLNTTGSYGVKGVPSASNFPSGRGRGTTWVDSQNNLWLYGGSTSNIFKSDLWKYDTNLNQWVWISGSQLANVNAYYGTKGVEDSLNNPGGRYSQTRYIDGQDNLYLYGTETTWPTVKTTNDVWKYNMSNGLWTWVAGTPQPATQGNYVASCDTSDNAPLPRADLRASWGDSCGCYFIGGRVSSGLTYYYNDLWYINTAMDEFTWVTGSQAANVACNYGIKGVSSSTNVPCPRAGALPFRDSLGNLWVFGGMGENGDYLNDLWMYTVDTTCFTNCKNNPPVLVKELNQADPKIYVFPNPADKVITVAGASTMTRLRVLDMAGREVTASVSVHNNSISVSALADGFYVLQFYNKTVPYSRKFIVRHAE